MRKRLESMKEAGYDLRRHNSKSLDDISDISYDFMVTMGCGERCPAVIRARQRRNWLIPDPKNGNSRQFDEVRGLLKAKVLALISEVLNGERRLAD